MKPYTNTIGLLALLFSVAISAHAQTITVKSSDTLAPLAQKWADAYMGQHSDTKIQVTGGETEAAFVALREKAIDIANVPRHIKFKEADACAKVFGKKPAEYKVGTDGLSVYVHGDNPVRYLTLEQLEGIFTGSFKNWKDVGGNDAPITVYSPESNSAAYEFFRQEVIYTKEPVSGTRELATPALLQAIANDKNAIGCGRLAQGPGVRALGLKRSQSSTPVEPSEETIIDQTYPLSRYLYNYLDPAAEKAELKAYLDYIRGNEGQKILKEAGFYTLPARFRSK